jgi:hypothetical protein
MIANCLLTALTVPRTGLNPFPIDLFIMPSLEDELTSPLADPYRILRH